MRRAIAIAILLVALSPAVAIAAFTWRYATVNSTPEATLIAKIKAEHFRVCGRDIRTTAQLTWAARYKAMDMGYRNKMSHPLVDGKLVWDFYSSAGVSWTRAGEILAWNNWPIDQSAQVAFNGWMNSSGHRAIIRDCRYTHFGVGAFRTKKGDSKWYAAEFVRTP